MDEATKICAGCRATKPISDFHKNRSNKDGLQIYCKPCMCAKNQESADRHRESKQSRNRAQRAEWRKANPEKAKAEYRDWYYGKGKGYHKKWQAENRETNRIVLQEWRKAHPNEMQHYGNVARLKREGYDPIHTLDEWMALLAKHEGKCAVCGSTDDICIDHVIPLSKGGTDAIENIQPLCRMCNASKGNKITDKNHAKSA